MSVEKRERLPVSVSSAVFIEDEKGRLLLLKQAAKRKGGKWGPPAGGMHAHENPIMTAQREVKEEIGVDVELVSILGIYTIDRGNNAFGIGFVFRGKIENEEIQIAEGEITDYRFFTPSEIEQLVSENMLYKPKYNMSGIKDWLEKHSYPLEIIKPLDY